MEAELSVNGGLDCGAGGGEIGVGSGAFVDKDEGGLGGDAEAVELLTFEAGVFD